MIYADAEYYRNQYHGELLDEASAERMLERASMQVDSLTYNRIVGQGFENLTEFQKNIIRKACCMQAEFLCENADMIENVLRGYAINGVSMDFGSSWNVFVQNGVAMRREVYGYLEQTGLCTRRL